MNVTAIHSTKEIKSEARIVLILQSVVRFLCVCMLESATFYLALYSSYLLDTIPYIDFYWTKYNILTCYCVYSLAHKVLHCINKTTI